MAERDTPIVTFSEQEGNLFAAVDLEALAHGCNCAGAMGAGIAVEFKRRWPQMFAEYRRRCKAGAFQPGDSFAWLADDGKVVYNLGTQKTWRTRATLEAIEAAVSLMLADAERRGIHSVGMPRVGAGLGGLAWERVREVLEGLSSQTPVSLVVYSLSCD